MAMHVLYHTVIVVDAFLSKKGFSKDSKFFERGNIQTPSIFLSPDLVIFLFSGEGLRHFCDSKKRVKNLKFVYDGYNFITKEKVSSLFHDLSAIRICARAESQ